MKTNFALSLVVVAALSASATWWLAQRHAAPRVLVADAGTGGRKIKHYQSSMHPWITSDRPGTCTICGMKLSPVYEGEKGFETAAGVVALGSNSIQVLNVRSEPALRGTMRRSIRVAGILEDDDTRHRFISAYADGRIDRLYVNYLGAEVEAGRTLAVMYSPMLLSAEREYALLASRPPEAGPTGARDHQVLLAAARARLSRYGLTETQIDAVAWKPATNIHTEIVTLQTGTIVSRMAYEGAYVKEGDKLFEIADFSTMWFKFDAYEQDLAWIRPGQIVRVTAPATPGKVFTAPIVFIEPTLNEPTRSAKVRVEIPNPLIEYQGRRYRELAHRMYAEGAVEVAMTNVLMVPRGAVLSPGHEPVVYLDLGGGAYEQRAIKLGRRGDAHWEILEGIDESDRVVSMGNLMIDAQAQLNRSLANRAAPAAASVEPLSHASEAEARQPADPDTTGPDKNTEAP